MVCTKCHSTDFSEVWGMMGGQGIVSCKICGSVNLVDPEPKRDFYADREAMNQRDQEILHTLGIKS